MKAILVILLLSLCSAFISGCNVRVSVSSDPASPTASKAKGFTKNDKGQVTFSDGIDKSKYQLTTLPSGKQIKLIAVTSVEFSQAGEPPALWLRYRTDLPIDDIPALRTEANEIWEDFRVEVEKRGFTAALISPTAVSVGDGTWKSKRFSLGWGKDKQGKWTSDN